MSKSEQRASGNTVGGDLTQRAVAENAKQVAENNKIKGNLTQEVLDSKKSDIEDLLKQVLAAIERLGLKDDEKNDVKVQAETAQAQMKAKKPSPTIVTESLKSIWQTLKGAATSAAASGAGMLAKELIDKIAGFMN